MLYKTQHALLLFLVLLLLPIITGCGPNEEAIATTIEQQISQVVAETMAARPAATDQPTLTPQPTFTTQATYTTQPTLTPAATSTLLPTYTPAPTLTPLPTATPTPTVVPTHTPLPRPVATAQPSVNVAAALLQEINITIAQMESFRGIIPPTCVQLGYLSNCNYAADCPSLVNQYDTITAPLILNVAQSSQEVQNAYAGYQSGLTIFADNLRDWIAQCRQSISAGTTLVASRDVGDALHLGVIAALNVLYPAKQILDNLQ